MDHPEFKAAVVERTRRINQHVSRLREWQGEAGAINRVLDEYELRQLKFIARVHHQIVTDPGFKVQGEHQKFLETCDWMAHRLEAHLHTNARPAKDNPPAVAVTASPILEEEAAPEPSFKATIYSTMAVGVLCLLILPFFYTNTVESKQWPPTTVLTENATDWIAVGCWTSLTTVATFQAMKWLARR